MPSHRRLARVAFALLVCSGVFAATSAYAAPDVSGSVVVNEDDGFPPICTAPCFSARKDFEVYLSGNPSAPGVCPAGENTYLYRIAHLGGPGPFIPAITEFEMELDTSQISSIGFLPASGGVAPSSSVIDTLNGVVGWKFESPVIAVPQESTQLFVCSPLLPGTTANVMISITGQASLDAPGLCVGPVDPPGTACELDVTKTCCVPPPPSFSGGNQCQGKVTELILRYTGDDCSATTNDQEGKAKCTDGSGALEPVDLVFVKEVDKMSATPDTGIATDTLVTIKSTSVKFKASTKFRLNDANGTLRQELTIHTSCSKQLNVGDVFGSMVLVQLTTTEGGTVTLPDPNGTEQETTMCIPAGDPPNTQCESKLTEVVFQYTGDSCSEGTTNSQGGKLSCSGDPEDFEPIDVMYTGKDAGDFTLSPDTGIGLGTNFTLTATGTDTLKASTKLELKDPNGALLQELGIHTSCSKPFGLGDQFGSLLVVQFSTEDGGTVTLADPEPPEDPTNECTVLSAPPGPHCTSRPTVIDFRFSGGDCSATTQDQEGKASCTDFGAIAAPVQIVVLEGSDVFLDTGSPASVQLGDVVSAQAGAGDRSDFPSTTTVQIFDAGGLLVQEQEIHTSCSKPLNLGDVFGAVEIFGLDPKDGPPVSLGGTVEYQYTVTNPAPPNIGPVNGVTLVDDTIGPIAGPLTLQQGESQTFFRQSVITSTTTNTVTATGSQASGACTPAQATATVTVEDPPPVPGSCLDGKPQQLIFEYLASDCSAGNNPQEGKASCSGPLDGEFPVTVVPTSGDYGVSPSCPGSDCISLNDPVTFTAGGSHFDSNTEFDVVQNGVVLQSVQIHTSCSKPLEEGDQFGSMLLQTFVPEP